MLLVCKMHVQWHILTAEAKDKTLLWESDTDINLWTEIILFLRIWCEFRVTFLSKEPNIFITLAQSVLKLLSYEDLWRSYKEYGE